MPCTLRISFSVELTEFACAENNPDYFHLDDYAVPTAAKPDF